MPSEILEKAKFVWLQLDVLEVNIERNLFRYDGKSWVDINLKTKLIKL